MSLLKKARNIVMVMIATWMSVSGTITLGLVNWIFNFHLPAWQVLLYGTLGGILAGGIIGLWLINFIRRKLRQKLQSFFVYISR